MKTVRVKRGKKVYFGRVYKEGEEFDVPDDHQVNEYSNIELADKPASPAPKKDEGPHDRETGISVAVSKLKHDDPEDWTADGLPSIPRLSEIAGFRILRAEINARYPGLSRNV